MRLGKNRIGDEGIKHIANFLDETNNFIESDVPSNDFLKKPEGLHNSEIVHLDVSQNQITHVGAKCLLQSLKYNKTIISLNLGNLE